MNAAEKKVWKLISDAHKRMRCLVCGFYGCTPCHIVTQKSGGSMDAFNLVNMCNEHHTEQGTIGWKKMSDKYDPIQQILWRKGWVF